MLEPEFTEVWVILPELLDGGLALPRRHDNESSTESVGNYLNLHGQGAVFPHRKGQIEVE